MSGAHIDPVAFSQDLIRRPSITPVDAGALDVLQAVLETLGFVCHRLPFGEGEGRVDNLYARFGTAAPNLCFAGHTDVVPPGPLDQWTTDPFAAEIRDGRLIGRGVVDMKAAIACFVSAVSRFLDARGDNFGGSISFLVTGDEEGPAINGTVKVLDWMRAHGEVLNACVVGEPTNPEVVGEMIKIGRRGSMNGYLTVHGTQGHSAYPHQADNPVHRIIRMLESITGAPLDKGTDHFQASTLEVTTVDVGNPVTNVIPGTAKAGFNIRFNDAHTAGSIEADLRRKFDAFGGRYDLKTEVSGVSFITPPGPLSDAIAAAVRTVVGRDPELSTSGGTSDARFIKDHCPVAEFGLISRTAHKVDECADVADIHALADIYLAFLDNHFG